jgi:hypothetical protein
MKPINYEQTENGVFKFIYDEKEYRNFHSLGKEHGDVGYILLEKDYNTLFTKYEGYGVIENPNKNLNYMSIQHSELLDGRFLTPEQIMSL